MVPIEALLIVVDPDCAISHAASKDLVLVARTVAGLDAVESNHDLIAVLRPSARLNDVATMLQVLQDVAVVIARLLVVWHIAIF